ncbi:MAG: ParB/RepB/Spo0J family partition protein [Pirellulales bacterium]|nr:ParB/RepB/Spo0J family partition protein [Pirellulales bacterium]
MKVQLDRLPLERNPRTKVEEAKIAALAHTLQLVGQQVPISLRAAGEEFELTDGMCRVLAARKLGWTEIEAIVDEHELNEAEVLQRQVVIHHQRADLPPLDKARAVSRLMEVAGCNASQAASNLGMSNATVTRLLSLLTLPEDIQRQVESGKLAASTAYELARTGDPTKQAELADAASNGSLSRDAVSGHVKRMRKPRSSNGRGSGLRAVAPLGDGRSLTVTGIEPSLDGFIACLEDALSRARRVRTKGHSLATFCKTLRDEAKTHAHQGAMP